MLLVFEQAPVTEQAPLARHKSPRSELRLGPSLAPRLLLPASRSNCRLPRS